MKRLLALLGGALVLAVAMAAWAQGTGTVNTPPGSVWTWLGPTYGAGWVFGPGRGGVVNVVTDFGADNTCSVDAAPAFRRMVEGATGKYMIAPPGCYLLGSTVPSGITAHNPANVRIKDQKDFVLDLRGAEFRTTNAASYSGMLQIDGTAPGAATRFEVLGGYFVGNHSGFAADAEACGIVPSSVSNFRFVGQRFGGNWGGLAAAFCGTWQANGSYRDIVAQNVGQCFDFAFLYNVAFDNIRGYGADADGTNGANKVGMKCFSFIYDVINSGGNQTDVAFSDNAGITVSNSSATNFIDGFYLASGRDYSFTGNRWYGNVGCTSLVGTCAVWNAYANAYGAAFSTAAGYGGVISYDGGGSVGHAVLGFISSGEHYIGNGNATNKGGGLYISTALLTGADRMSDYVMVNSVARGNSDTVVEASAASFDKLLNVNFQPICTNDATAQTRCMGPNLVSIRNPLANSGAVIGFNNQNGIYQSFASVIQGNGAAFRNTGVPGNTGGASISVLNCGTSPTLNGNNIAGFITIGSGSNPNACQLFFSASYSNQPVCLVTSNQAARPVYPSSITPTYAMFSSTTGTISPGDILAYQCSGFQ